MANPSASPSPAETPEEDLTGVMWNDRLWLNHFPLNKETVFDYFSQSQFYDRSCNNELIRMQRLDPTLLSKMSGIEYVVSHHVEPSLYVITKQRRTLEPKLIIESLATYYVIDGNVYQAPTAHAVFSSRILQSLHHVKNAFGEIQKYAKFDSAGRHGWVVPPPAVARQDLKWGGDREGDRELTAERRLIDRLLHGALEENRRLAEDFAQKQQQQEQPMQQE